MLRLRIQTVSSLRKVSVVELRCRIPSILPENNLWLMDTARRSIRMVVVEAGADAFARRRFL
jgi:hypothetical protein